MPLIPTGPLSLFYQEIGAGEPVLWLPGLGADHTAWGPQIAALKDHFRCFAIDNRDCGRSGRATDGYGIRDMAADTIGLMDGLGQASAHIVGWSMGGAIAQEMALGWPDRVLSLCLVATYDEGDPRSGDRFALAAEIRRSLGFEAYLRFAHLSIYTHRAYQRPGLIANARRRAMEYPYQQTVDDYERQAWATTHHHTRDRLHRIGCPTLVLAGEEDVLTPVDSVLPPHGCGNPECDPGGVPRGGPRPAVGTA
ncbi:MAG: alpha/beta hydrolase [Dehalococcoidia bacterium]|nr:alpha/beta hydrolase [Dehalococcoidia bacterium]